MKKESNKKGKRFSYSFYLRAVIIINHLQELKNQLENIFSEMPQTHFQLEQRNKSAFLISREIEKIENPKGYELNKNHFEGYELRL